MRANRIGPYLTGLKVQWQERNLEFSESGQKMPVNSRVDYSTGRSNAVEISYCETAFQSRELHKVLPLSMQCQLHRKRKNERAGKRQC